MQLPCRRLRRPRRVVPDVGRWPLVRRRWRCGCGSLTARPGCLPGHRDRLDRLDSPGFDPGPSTKPCPVVPRESSERLARPPPAVFGCPRGPALWAPGASGRSAPAARPWSAWRIRAQCRRISPATPQCASIAEWHPGVGVHSHGMPRPRRIPTGCPVSRSGRNGSRPGHHRAAPERLQINTRHQSGTSAACLAALPRLRSRPI